MTTSADRARLLIKKIGPKKASNHGGDYERWRSVSKGAVRVSTEEIDILVNIFPKYALWLASGRIAPEIGQTSPEYDETQREPLEPVSSPHESMGSTRDRALPLLRMMGPKKLSQLGGPNYERWRNISKGAIRMSTEELGVLVKIFPQYALWLVSGQVVPEIAQTCPEYDGAHLEPSSQDDGRG